MTYRVDKVSMMLKTIHTAVASAVSNNQKSALVAARREEESLLIVGLAETSYRSGRAVFNRVNEFDPGNVEIYFFSLTNKSYSFELHVSDWTT